MCTHTYSSSYYDVKENKDLIWFDLIWVSEKCSIMGGQEQKNALHGNKKTIIHRLRCYSKLYSLQYMHNLHGPFLM